jgi:hypothetical protein
MKLDFHCDEVVIGGDLNAFFYSYKNDVPLLINKARTPHRFEKEEGLWNKLYFLLSLSGHNMFGDKIDTIRIDEKQLTVATKEFKVVKVGFDKLTVFDDQSISGLPIPAKECNEYAVLDWMIAKSCASHDLEHISTKDNFVKDIYFYPTERLDGNHSRIRDLVSVSHMTKKQIKDFNYSDTYARFKTEKILKENGLTGVKSGFQNGKQITYTLRLEVIKRELRKLNMHLYEDTENIKFKYKSEFQNEISTCSYINKLNNILNVV